MRTFKRIYVIAMLCYAVLGEVELERQDKDCPEIHRVFAKFTGSRFKMDVMLKMTLKTSAKGARPPSYSTYSFTSPIKMFQDGQEESYWVSLDDTAEQERMLGITNASVEDTVILNEAFKFWIKVDKDLLWVVLEFAEKDKEPSCQYAMYKKASSIMSHLNSLRL
ncbi:hypothetical protein FOL47_002979 [Perkinsus chesapeaki]|uniref:Uncharacterized protein n=1 Tax=Perkinsus chesapeaki TaxID=330153 RepID=A0A7J6MAV4_PERCH|nr:hypothetical protein FOL47_002979 [Perkinsus chesapeaki]